ncbi:JAB domain-containing protein [Lonsdalea quercina]|uniref:JAB domain-containing protein n=1 Tax=Lonsdalea quercina TaxID=71657 RepID=UPI003976B77F
MSELIQYGPFSPTDKMLIAQAIQAIEKQFFRACENTPAFTSSLMVIDYLRLQLSEHDREHFMVLFLNSQNQLIAAEKLFSGDLARVEVHPRIIARKALIHNSRSLILAHNHPSGNALPSQADRELTCNIAQCLSLFDINILDHIIITPGDAYYAFSQHGEI